MMRSLTMLVTVLSVLAVVSAVPLSIATAESCHEHTSQGTCFADPCCNWCRRPGADAASFCVFNNPLDTVDLKCERSTYVDTTNCQHKIIPKAAPFVEKVAPVEKAQPAVVQVAFKDCHSHDKNGCFSDPCCNWCRRPHADDIDFCVYNNPLDTVDFKCEKPKELDSKCAPNEPVAVAETKPAVAEIPTKKGLCSADSAEVCDANPCCQWCSTGSAFSAAEWCMPLLEWKEESLKCSKGEAKCSSMKTSDDCASNVACSWVDFKEGGGGTCYFDWGKCNK